MSEHRTPAGGIITACDEASGCVPRRCAQCLKELPADQPTVPDARDYVQHFCGLDCLAEWQRRSASHDKTPKP